MPPTSRHAGRPFVIGGWTPAGKPPSFAPCTNHSLTRPAGARPRSSPSATRPLASPWPPNPRPTIAPKFRPSTNGISAPSFPTGTPGRQGMKALDAKMTEFAALKGTLARGPQAVLHAYRLLGRDRHAAGQGYSYTATAARHSTRATRTSAPGSSACRHSRQIRHRHGVVHPGTADHPAGDHGAVDRADARPRHLSLHHPRQLPPAEARPRREGRTAAFLQHPRQRYAAHGLPGVVHLGHQVSQGHPGRRQGRDAHAGRLSGDPRHRLQPGRPDEVVRGTI